MAWFNLKNILKKKKFGGVRDIINKDGEEDLETLENTVMDEEDDEEWEYSIESEIYALNIVDWERIPLSPTTPLKKYSIEDQEYYYFMVHREDRKICECPNRKEYYVRCLPGKPSDERFIIKIEKNYVLSIELEDNTGAIIVFLKKKHVQSVGSVVRSGSDIPEYIKRWRGLSM